MSKALLDRLSERKKQDQLEMTEQEKALKETDHIPDQMEEVKKVLEEQVGLNKSFDVVMREMVFGSVRTGFVFINGFAKDEVLTEIIKRLTYVEKEELELNALKHFMEQLVPHIQVIKVDKMSEAVNKVLSGSTALFIENETSALVIDAKRLPTRTTEEPDLERVVRGARDGFIETLLTNVTLVRRRIRDPRLKVELMQVGERTQTDVCIAYIEDIADPELVKSIKGKISKIKVDGIPLADKQLEEAMGKKGWSPYPLVRYSERPDVVSAHLLEGHIAVMVDTSPSVLILPATFFHLVQHAEEYRQAPLIGTYIRWIRFIGIVLSIFLLPLWYLMVNHPEYKPVGMEWLGPEKIGHLPILLQFLCAEIGIDLMRMAAVHTPTPLATALGLVAAILIGDIAVKTGVFNNEVILYLSIASIGIFATPSYELGMANKLSRIALLILTGIFAAPGFIIGSTLWVLMLVTQRSYNSPYLWPFIPFNAKGLFSIIIRRPFISMKTRLSLTKPIDSSRQPQ